MDAIDLRLIELLTAHARTSYAGLAQEVGLSAPSTAERVRRLEERGTVLGYAALVDPAALGRDLTAFVAVSVGDRAQTRAFLTAVSRLPEVVECHHVAGDDDYLLKVHVDGTHGLERLVTDQLKAIAGVSRTRTTVVLSTTLDRPVSVDGGA